MKKRAKPGPRLLHECPFCGFLNANPPTATPWCGNRDCAVEYYHSKTWRVWYDTERKTSAPLAKSVWAVGGFRIGSDD